jgi:2-keto-4-pentenoate hydratase/2-oxohepta-3-ene-1,7-dioic acid hydratase in catechol pathway
MRFGTIVDRNLGKIFCRLDGDKAIAYGAPPWLGGKEQKDVFDLKDVALDAPLQPGKIICVGRNYAAHAKEMGNDVPKEPMIFLKPPSSVVGPGATVILPKGATRVEHEGELAIVIGSTVKKASRAQVEAGIFGYTCALDVSARDWQKGDGQWWRAKGSDTFCPIGPHIETQLDVAAASVICRVNGNVRQDGHAKDMIFDIPTFIAHVSQVMTLNPGDLFLSGSPEGVGPIVDGDAVEVEVTGIGILRVSVAAENAE